MRHIVFLFSVVTASVVAQPSSGLVVHQVPFSAEGNTFALAVANVSENRATAATVTLADVPAWLAVTPAEISLDEIAPGEEAPAAFSFDVSRDAPVAETAAVHFTITTADGQTVEKSVWLEVAAPADLCIDGPTQPRSWGVDPW